nr:RNA-directed DNA polymerase, eukaryota [Tanacetum cinerariifolium]
MMIGVDYYQTDSEIAAMLASERVLIVVGQNIKITNCIIDKNAKSGKNEAIAYKDNVEEADRLDEGLVAKFITEEEDNSSSDNESEGGNNENDIGLDQRNEYDHVFETSFAQGDDNENTEDSKVESVDPQYPLGFTPDVVEENDVENSSGKFSKPNTTDKVMGDHGSKFQASGSILEVMDELIKAGQTMSYNMDGCVKNIEAIIGTWIPSATKLLIISIYAPQDPNERRIIDLNSITLLYLAIREVLEDDWIVEPSKVKNEFLKHFTNRFAEQLLKVLLLNLHFQKCLSSDQNKDLERNVSSDEIKRTVWDYRTNISHGPDGFTFEFYRRYWKLIYQDVVVDVNLLFDSGSFPLEYNSSFITLIPKTQKVVKDFRPISLIGNVYKIITKILANRLSLVIFDLVSDVQSPFVSNRQILDGPFISVSFYRGVLKWFFFASGLKINLHKSKLIGIGVSHNVVVSAARSIGCLTFHTPFTYLVVKVGGNMSRLNSWEDFVAKLTSRLSKWKLKTLWIGGHLTLIKLVLSSLPLYYMSSFKSFSMVLIYYSHAWCSWSSGQSSCFSKRSPWLDIVHEFKTLYNNGIDLLSLVKKKVGNGVSTTFWDDVWLDDSLLKKMYPRLYLLEADKHSSVAAKLSDHTLSASFKRPPRGGIEEEQL